MDSTNKKEDKTQKTQNLDPLGLFSPERTGLPFYVIGKDGKRIGGLWSPEQFGFSDAMNKIRSGESSKLYFDKVKGVFTNTPSSSMAYSNGKIKINLSNDFAESDWYKKNFQGDEFKALAKLYAKDPTGETVVGEADEEQEDGTTKKVPRTINQLLAEYASRLEEESEKYESAVNLRESMKKLSNGAMNLTDSDMAIMATTNRIKAGNYSSSDVWLLPDSVKDYFRDYDTYIDGVDGGSISADTFYKDFYHLDREIKDSLKEAIDILGGGALGDDSEALQNVGESNKDYAIDLIRLKVEQEQEEIVNRLAFYKDDLSEEERARLTTEYAKCYALQHAMEEDQPGSEPWTGFNLWVQNIAYSAGSSLDALFGNIVELLNNINSGVINATDTMLSTVVGTVDFLGDVVGNFATGGFDKVAANIDTSVGRYQEAYDRYVGEGSLNNKFLEQSKQAVESIKEHGGLVLTIASNTTGKKLDYASTIEDMVKSYAEAEKAQIVGKLVALAVEQVLFVNPIGEAVGNFIGGGVVSFFTGIKPETFISATETLAALSVTSNSIAMMNRWMSYLNMIGRVSNIFGFLANMHMQGIVETLLENPSYSDALIYGASLEDVAEFQSMVAWSTTFNAAAELLPFAGKGGRAAMKRVEQTTVGKISQAQLRKIMNRVTLFGRKRLQSLSEFMTRGKKGMTVENIIEDGKEITVKKLAPWKRWQDIRKEIIEIQESIKETNLWRHAEDGSVLENAKLIDDLIDKRIEVETRLAITKRLAIAETSLRIIKRAGLDAEVTEIADYTARLSKLSRKLGQENLPGTFSRETGDYVNDLFNANRLTRKKAWAEAKGKLFSESDAEALAGITKRIADYEASLPAELAEEYKQLVKDYMASNYRFYYKLNDYLSSDAGGNIISEETLKEMRSNTQYGEAGEMFMPLYAINFKGKASLEEFLNDPEKIIQQGVVKNEVKTLSRKAASAETKYFDPNYSRMLRLKAYAQAIHAADMGDAIIRAGRATSVQISEDGTVFATKAELYAAKRDLSDGMEKAFKGALKENAPDLGKQTAKANKTSYRYFFKNQASKAKSKINQILRLNKNGLKEYAADLSSEEVSQLSTVFALPAYSTKIRTRAQLDAFYNSLTEEQKKIVEKTLNGAKLNVRTWNEAVLNDNMDVLLARQYIKESRTILESDYYKNMVAAARETELVEEQAMALREAKISLEDAEKNMATGKAAETPEVKAKVKETQKNFRNTARKSITSAVNATVEWLESEASPYLEALLREYEKQGVSSDLARRYIVLEWLYKNSNNKGLRHIMKEFYGSAEMSGVNVKTGSVGHMADKFVEAVKSNIESRFNNVSRKILDSGVDGLVDVSLVSKEVDKQILDIVGKIESKNAVRVFDRISGKFKYYEVDNSTYNLVMYYPTFKKNGPFVRLMARLNSIARLGQITFRAASLVTQGFKDSINAIILGGWDQVLLDNPETYKKIAQYIGPDVVETFRKEMTPSAWKEFLEQATQEGLTVEEAIAKSEVSNELLNLKITGGGTSSEYFSAKNLYGEMDKTATQITKQAEDTWKGDVKSKWQEAYAKAKEQLAVAHGWGEKVSPAKIMNGMHDLRENFLRRQVYRQNFMDSLSNGKSLAQSRRYAQYVMENATTNFKRGFAWGEGIVKSIPFFGAALNGASSMVRLLEVDPLGVMMRFTTDLVIPTVGLTVLSLQNPTDAEIYKNIPEYRKRENLIWVTGGRVMTIPLPEEMARFILPIRHIVESIAGANKNSWTELMVNDLLNMPVVPLNGIMALDTKRIKADPTILDRLSETALDMFNVLAPTAARTAYIAATGRDPYTGKNYAKERYVQTASGSYELATQSEFDFLNDLATLFKGWGIEINPLIAEGMLNTALGTGSLDLIEGIRDLAAGVGNESPVIRFLEPSLERAGNVLYDEPVTNEQQSLYAWYDLSSRLNEEKKKILTKGGKLATISNDIDMAKDSDSYDKAKEAYDNAVHDWQSYVIDEVKAYKEMYGNYFDKSKFASTISLMTTQFSIGPDRDSSEYNNAREQAIRTMYDAGFTSTSDNSVFGYITRDDKTGEVKVNYYSPLVVSLSQNILWYQAGNIANMVTNALDFSGVKDRFNKEVYPLYKKYMEEKDYKSANKIASDWDYELVRLTKPILDTYTVGNPFEKRDIINAYYSYYLTPNDDNYLGKGQYYSSKTGLNKKSGFITHVLTMIYEDMKEDSNGQK